MQYFLEVAAQRSRGRVAPDDILRMFFTGQYQLWVVLNERHIVMGFYASTINVHPQKKMLCFQHCVLAPHVMKVVEADMEIKGMQFAKDNGCAGIEFMGRLGWRRYANTHGYDKQSVLYQKFFEGADHG